MLQTETSLSGLFVRHWCEAEAMLTAQLIIARAVHIGASILLAGIFTFDLLILAPARRVGSDDSYEIEHRLFRVAAWSIVAALLSAFLWFWLEVASMSGLPLKSAFAVAAWRTVLFETQFGRVWQLRLGLIVAAFALVATGLAKVKARRVLTPVLRLVSVVFLVSLAWISHAAAASVRSLGLLGDMLHLCAAGGWIGGLVPLTIFLARVRAPFSLGETVARVVHRFSTLSLCCVSVLVVSGICNSWLLVVRFTPFSRRLMAAFCFLSSRSSPSSLVSARATGCSLKQSCYKPPLRQTCCFDSVEMCSARSLLVSRWSQSLRV
jgi:copper resistance protein D